MENNKYNLALAEEIINIKIANAINNKNANAIESVKEEVSKLQDEKEQIFKNNEEIINKVLTEYLKDVRK